MAVIAVYSVKGGVGKTTIAANLAWCSAAPSKRKTLLWDLDAAGGAGYLVGVDPGEHAADSVFAPDARPDTLVQATAYERLDVLPADESLRSLDGLFARLGKKKRLAKLAQTLSRQYDRIVLDCPPVRSEVSAQALRAADCIIVPLPPSPLSSRAFELVAREIAAHAVPRPPLLPVLSMLDRRRALHRDLQEANPTWPAIPLASALEQCATRRAPVGAFAPHSPSAQAFAQLWSGIERRLTRR